MKNDDDADDTNPGIAALEQKMGDGKGQRIHGTVREVSFKHHKQHGHYAEIRVQHGEHRRSKSPMVGDDESYPLHSTVHVPRSHGMQFKHGDKVHISLHHAD